ncbi:MAG: DUF192 domain-containing protein [Elusimicrobiota bacterium]
MKNTGDNGSRTIFLETNNETQRYMSIIKSFLRFSKYMKVRILLSLLISLPVIQPTVTFNDTEFSVEIADSSEERAKGLMNRKHLSEDNGMLFVYNKENSRSFWMKNTTIPLDIIFLDSDLEVINIEAADPEPDTSDEDLQRYRSERPAQYVLEINQNRSEEIGLEKGNKMGLGLELRP